MDNSNLFDSAILNLSTRIINCLNRNGIETIIDLEKIPNEETLIEFKGIGYKAIQNIKAEYFRVFGKDLFLNKQINQQGELVSNEKIKKISLLNKDQIRRIIQIKRLYENVGSLQGVGDLLNLSRERVRQLLKKGEKSGLFKNKPTNIITIPNSESKKIVGELIKEFKKQLTITEIKPISNIELPDKSLYPVSTCNRCGRSWWRRGKELPKNCPICKSPYWNKKRKYNLKSERISKIRI